MSFSVVKRRTLSTPIPAGKATLTKAGQLGIHRTDLASVKIADTVVLLADRDTCRLAVRRPRDDEAADARAVAKAKGARRTVSINGALAELGLKAADMAARYELTKKDDLLILSPMAPAHKECEKHPRHAARPT
jgi:hypothetical protein